MYINGDYGPTPFFVVFLFLFQLFTLHLPTPFSFSVFFLFLFFLILISKAHSTISEMATRFALQSPLRTALFSTRSSNITHRSFASVSAFHGRIHKDQKELVHGEPERPKIVTSTIPGPKTKAGLQHLDSLQDTRAATMMTGKKEHDLTEKKGV